MPRTDDDNWDITEIVGATALGVAMARAAESACDCPLFTDPYAQLFIDAATERGWEPTTSMTERVRIVGGYAAARTKWFDEYFIAAGANGIDQAVILAAGLDARAWRLPWVEGSVVYEIDQRQVLAFKADTLGAHGAQPPTSYRAVPIDLREDWPKALRQAGFDPSAPTAWSAEGLLPYLPATGQDLLFDRVADLSAAGSRMAVEALSPDSFDPEYLERRRQQLRRAGVDASVPDTADLWFIEERSDLTEWLTERGWEVTAIEALNLMERYGRAPEGDLEDLAPRSMFIELLASRAYSESWNSTIAETVSTASPSAASRSAADGAASTEYRSAWPMGTRDANAYRRAPASTVSSSIPSTAARSGSKTSRAAATRSNNAITRSSSSRSWLAVTGSPGSSGQARTIARG
jgi:methyltransferase (TIGR00027 family)